MWPRHHMEANHSPTERHMDPEESRREKRRHERYFMQFPVSIVFENGQTLQGISHDVSLAGLFVHARPTLDMEETTNGEGTIQMGKDRYTFKCRVARRNAAGFGISIVRNNPILGFAITNHIFNQISTCRLI
ncbi:MAG: PilZ domain-containing protein [Magnetococcales bacterium]|nr:PilZ domain-containing protein [Magnetococcales bacterium]